MQFQDPAGGLGLHTADAAVLKVLSRVETQLTAPEIFRISGGASSLSSIRRSLARLVEIGLVLDQWAGNTGLYRFNPDHLLAPAVKSLLDVGERFRHRLVTDIEQWQRKPIAVILFGSASRGDMQLGSDIDLMFLVGSWGESELAPIFELCDRILDWTGNTANPLIMRVNEVRWSPLIEEILRDGQVLFGDRAEAFEILRGTHGGESGEDKNSEGLEGRPEVEGSADERPERSRAVG